jgi:hypothetical protein
MVDIWASVDAKSAIKPMMASIVRFVESQQQVATLSLVNNVYEQGVLEELLESTKHAMPKNTDTLHYLLTTPFRYPPLIHGSRFGTTFERGIFYGSLNTTTALAEVAYYRFVYMLGPETPYQDTISTEYTAFSVSVKTNLGLCLDEPPFSQYETILSSPSSYASSQQLGAYMRQHGVEGFRYVSARDKHKGKNIGLLSHSGFHNKKPTQLRRWFCQTNIDEVGFLSEENQMRMMFKQQDFWVEGKFPSPAVA